MDSKSERWRYIWNQNGTLKEVRPPGGGDFAFDALFTYDALGRRLSKDAIGITCWLWNGNVPLHEWTPSQRRNEQGEIEEYQKDLRTWLFEEESFVPLALFQDGKAYSIVTDHLGTPVEAYNEQGEEVWYRRLDMNGKVIEERSMNYTSYKDYVKIPFLFQGQYYDEEIKLAYNRFRYYAPELGRYISEDPIGLESGELNLFSYVENPTFFIDFFGLAPWGRGEKSFDAWWKTAKQKTIAKNIKTVKRHLRAGGGKHEMFPVSLAPEAKRLGFTPQELRKMTLDTEGLKIQYEAERGLHHSSKASSLFHAELTRAIISSKSKSEAKTIIDNLHQKHVVGYKNNK